MNKEMIKRFEKEFENADFPKNLAGHRSDIRIKQFIKSEIDLAVAQRDKEIVEYLNRLDGKNSLFGYQTAVRDVLTFIKTN